MDKENDGNTLFVMISSLISIYRDKKINDFDLYNSIIRLVHFNSGKNKDELEKIITWLDKEEKDGIHPQDQYQAEHVKLNAGENYFEGLQQLIPEEYLAESIKEMEERINNPAASGRGMTEEYGPSARA